MQKGRQFTLQHEFKRHYDVSQSQGTREVFGRPETLLMQFLYSGILQYLDYYLLHFNNYFITALGGRRGRRETVAIALLPNNFICKRIQIKCSCSAIKSPGQFKIQRNHENLCLGVFILFQTPFLFGSKYPVIRNKYCRVK